MDELQSQIDDIVSRQDDNDESVQSLSDNTDTAFQDVQTSLDDHTDKIDSLNETAGQLQFPLTQDTIDLINEQFPRGSFTLGAGGTYTLLDGRISTTSQFLYSVIVPNFGAGTLYYTITKSAGQIIIQSSLSDDVSSFDYLLLP